MNVNVNVNECIHSLIGNDEEYKLSATNPFSPLYLIKPIGFKYSV